MTLWLSTSMSLLFFALNSHPLSPPPSGQRFFTNGFVLAFIMATFNMLASVLRHNALHRTIRASLNFRSALQDSIFAKVTSFTVSGGP